MIVIGMHVTNSTATCIYKKKQLKQVIFISVVRLHSATSEASEQTITFINFKFKTIAFF